MLEPESDTSDPISNPTLEMTSKFGISSYVILLGNYTYTILEVGSVIKSRHKFKISNFCITNIFWKIIFWDTQSSQYFCKIFIGIRVQSAFIYSYIFTHFYVSLTVFKIFPQIFKYFFETLKIIKKWYYLLLTIYSFLWIFNLLFFFFWGNYNAICYFINN